MIFSDQSRQAFRLALYEIFSEPDSPIQSVRVANELAEQALNETGRLGISPAQLCVDVAMASPTGVPTRALDRAEVDKFVELVKAYWAMAYGTNTTSLGVDHIAYNPSSLCEILSERFEHWSEQTESHIDKRRKEFRFHCRLPARNDVKCGLSLWGSYVSRGNISCAVGYVKAGELLADVNLSWLFLWPYLKAARVNTTASQIQLVELVDKVFEMSLAASRVEL